MAVPGQRKPNAAMIKQKKASQKKQAMWGQIKLGSFEASFPQPRLPRILGSDRDLPSTNSVYPHIRLDVPMHQKIVNIVAGACAGVVPLDLTSINNWSRFQNLFREYAIVGARLEVRLNNVSTTAGIVTAFIDEQTSTPPTNQDALNRPRLDMLCGPLFVPRAYRLSWMPRDILDLDYTNVATTFTPAWLKVFTNVADLNTNAATTGQVIVTGTLALEFRGYL